MFLFYLPASSNSAGIDAGGGIRNTASTLTVTGGTFAFNSAETNGGWIGNFGLSFSAVGDAVDMGAYEVQ